MSETPGRSDPPVPGGDILPANVIGPGQVEIGMAVTTVDDHRVGTVKEIGDTEFLVDRPLAHDLWIPYSAVLAAEGHGDGFRAVPPRPTDVVLSISGAHIDAQGWRHA